MRHHAVVASFVLVHLVHLLPLAAGLTAQATPTPAPLWRPAVATDAAESWHTAERAANPAIVAHRFVRPNVDALRRFALDVSGAAATFDLSPFAVPPVALVRRADVHGHLCFDGTLPGNGTFVVVVAADGTTAAHGESGDLAFALRPAGPSGLHVLETLDGSRDTRPERGCGNDASHAVTAPVDPAGNVTPLSAGSITTIDVCLFYTPAARTSAGGASAIQAELALRIANATAGCRASGVDIEYRLVYVGETNYVELGTSTDLSRFRSTTDGHMDEVHAIRTNHGGDLMGLIINQSSSFCGVGYLMTNNSTGFRTSAFSVTVRTCLSGHTLTHEMGHTQGCSHDRANASNALFPYSYGYRTPDNRFRTIMAYSPGARVNVWSGPLVNYSGYVMGVANSEDNARSLGTARGTIAQFAATQTLRWVEVPGGIAGLGGRPTIAGVGTKNGVVPIRVTLGNLRPSTPGAIVLGTTAGNVPLFGGVLVPQPALTLPLTTPPAGTISIDASFLARLPVGTDVFWQAFYVDAAAAQGMSATNGLQVEVP